MGMCNKSEKDVNLILGERIQIPGQINSETMQGYYVKWNDWWMNKSPKDQQYNPTTMVYMVTNHHGVLQLQHCQERIIADYINRAVTRS